MRPLVLSLFPGLDLLGRGFGIEGACVVAGPDVVWGGDIRGWHVPPGRFDGVIGGPPCQTFSRLAALGRAQGHEPRFGNLIPEFERVVSEAHPHWFVMEEVPEAPLPEVDGYEIWCALIRHSDLGGAQPRERRITFGLRRGRWQSLASPFTLLEYRLEAVNSYSLLGNSHGPLPSSVLADSRRTPVRLGGSGKVKAPTVLAGHGAAPGQRDAVYVRPDAEGQPRLLDIEIEPRPVRPAGRSRSVTTGGGTGVRSVTSSAGGTPDRGSPAMRMSIAEMLELQDAPPDLLDDSPFTAHGKRSLVGNAVPVLMARAVARMVWRALEEDWGSRAGS